MNINIKIGIFIALILVPPYAYSGDFKGSGRSMRAMAMGDTGISSAHDNDALFYNPATLPNLQRSYFDLATVQLSSPFGLTEVFDGYNASTRSNADDIKNVLENNVEADRVTALAFVSGNYQFADRGWNFAGYGGVEFDSVYTNNTNDPKSTVLVSRYDQMAGIGISAPLFLGDNSFGIGLKGIKRRQAKYSYSLAPGAVNETIPSSTNRGEALTAYGVDLGYMYRMPGQLRLRTSLAMLNVGGLKFSDKSYDTPQELNFGVSVGPTFAHWRTLIALDIRDILQENGKTATGEKDDSWVKRSHFGMELGYFVERKTFGLLNFRVGANQGLLTYGMEMNFIFGRTIVLGYTYFQEDLGDGSTKKVVKNNVYYVSFGI